MMEIKKRKKIKQITAFLAVFVSGMAQFCRASQDPVQECSFEANKKLLAIRLPNLLVAYKKKLAQLTERNAQLAEDNASLQEENDSLRQANAKRKQDDQRREDVAAQLAADSQASTQQLRGRIANLEVQNSSLQEKLEELEGRNRELQEAAFDELARQLGSLDLEVEPRKRFLERVRKLFTVVIENPRQNFLRGVKSGRVGFRKTIKSSADRALSNDCFRSLVAKINGLNSSLTKLQKSVNAFSREKEGLRRKIERLSSRSSSTPSPCRRKRDAEQTCEEDCTNALRQLGEIRSMTQRIFDNENQALSNVNVAIKDYATSCGITLRTFTDKISQMLRQCEVDAQSSGAARSRLKKARVRPSNIPNSSTQSSPAATPPTTPRMTGPGCDSDSACVTSKIDSQVQRRSRSRNGRQKRNQANMRSRSRQKSRQSRSLQENDGEIC